MTPSVERIEERLKRLMQESRKVREHANNVAMLLDRLESDVMQLANELTAREEKE